MYEELEPGLAARGAAGMIPPEQADPGSAFASVSAGPDAPEAGAAAEPGAAPVIGPAELKRAMEILRRYKAGKAGLERRILDNEEWWRMRHWDRIPEQDSTGLRTRSAWLVNVILSKHADAMDALPEPAFLPRSADDAEQARLLSAVVPVIL